MAAAEGLEEEADSGCEGTETGTGLEVFSVSVYHSETGQLLQHGADGEGVYQLRLESWAGRIRLEHNPKQCPVCDREALKVVRGHGMVCRACSRSFSWVELGRARDRLYDLKPPVVPWSE